MSHIVRYLVGIVLAIVAFKVVTAALGALFGSFAGLVVLVLIGWLIWRALSRRPRTT